MVDVLPSHHLLETEYVHTPGGYAACTMQQACISSFIHMAEHWQLNRSFNGPNAAVLSTLGLMSVGEILI